VQAIWLSILGCGALLAQAAISGSVVHDVTGEPLKRVAITLTGGSAHDSPATVTDAQGKFQFAAVSPGKYRLTAEKAPFLRWEHGQQKPLAAGTSIELANGEERTGLAIRLRPGATVSGRVTEEDNEPAVGAQITLLRVSYLNGRRQLSTVGHASTDDRGEYRLHSIPPGRFLLRANFERFYLPTRVNQRYLGTYHPAADHPDQATWLSISPGTELRGINVALRPTTTHRIQGILVDAVTGQTIRDANVMLFSASGDEDFARGFIRNELGTFAFPAVAAGSYTITATRNVAEQLSYGRVRVDVSQDADGIRVRMEPGLRVEGRVRVEGDGTVNLDKGSLRLETSEFIGFGGSVSIAADGTFATGPLPAAAVTPNLTNLDGAYLRAIRVNEQSVAGSLIRLPAVAGTVRMEVILSTNGATVEGAVGNAVGAVIVLEPGADQDFRRSRYRVAKSDQTGHFKLTGVAPGEYRIYAFDDIDDGAWLDASYMAAYAGKGETVKVAERETRTVALRMIAGGE
jgi:hypothetical protein